MKQKIVNRKLYLFGGDKIRIKFPETIKIGLNIREIGIIEHLVVLTPSERHAKNVWLYSFNFEGMRVTDVLKTTWLDNNHNRLLYRTGNNSKLISLKIPKKASANTCAYSTIASYNTC